MSIGTLISSVSGLKSHEQGLEVIGDNMANVNSRSYKTTRAGFTNSFSNLLSRSTPATGSGSNRPAVQVGTGAKLGGVTTDFSQGVITPTGIDTDMAIDGNGFFKVKNVVSSQEYATRDGSFRVDDQGYFTTNDGLRLQGLGGGTISFAASELNGKLVYTPNIVAPSTVGDIRLDYNLSIGNGLSNNTSGAFTDQQVEENVPSVTGLTIDPSGNVHLLLSDNTSFIKGRVLTVDFSDPQALVRESNGLYSGFGAAGIKSGNSFDAANNTPGSNGLGEIKAASLELSNVNLTDQFAELIKTQRGFQANARVVSVSDEVMNEVVNLKR